MEKSQSINFFDRQFRSQPKALALRLNPFEELALPYLSGSVLDFGCGMGNLAFEAARRGCKVMALDGSPAAIAHIRQRAKEEGASVAAALADLRSYSITGQYDSVASIGLLMFFDCDSASRVLSALQACVRPGGVAAINVLIEGTTYLGMFDAAGYCLFNPDALERRFSGWQIERLEFEDFEAPEHTLKRFCTLVARKPEA